MKKINQYKRTYYKEQGAIIGLVMCIVIFALPYLQDASDDEYVAGKEEAAFMLPIIIEEQTYDRYMEQVDECNKSGGHVLTSSHSNNSICTTPSIEIGKKVEPTIKDKIRKYFPKSHVTMLAIAEAESGLDHNQQNWNCFYYQGKATTTPIKDGSTSCKKADRYMSWSIDCGLLMKNYIGIKTCPVVPIDEHLKEMAELSKARGFQPWSSYNSGRYLEYMPKNHLATN